MEYNFKDGKAAARTGNTGYDVSTLQTLIFSRSAGQLDIWVCSIVKHCKKFQSVKYGPCALTQPECSLLGEFSE